MFKPFPLFVGIRYTNLKRRDHFITFISLVSMLGIALGVMVLITVMSVMNGFTKEIRTRIFSVTPHIMVGNWGAPMLDWQEAQRQILSHKDIVQAGPFVEGQGMLARGRNVRGVMLKGIVPDEVDAIFPLKETLVQGKVQGLVPGKFGIILGQGLAKLLGVGLGDRVTLVIPEANVTMAGVVPRLKRLEVVGIFQVGYIYDNGYGFLHLEDAAKVYKTQGGVTGIQAKVTDPFMTPRIAQQLVQKHDNKYSVVDWTLLNSSYFSAVKMEKTMMFFTLMLILVIAIFGLLSTLVMVVTDKRGDIAVLRALGASTRKVMAIFICQGAIIGCIGTGLGVLLGVALSLNVTQIVSAIEKALSVQFLSADVYFISFLPSSLELSDVIWTAISAFVLSLVATIIPAYRAANVLPAEALRNDA